MNAIEKIVLSIIIINALLSIVYVFVKIKKGQNAWFFTFFLSLPVIGFILYFAPKWLQKALGKESYDRDSLVKRVEIEEMEQMPDVVKELNIIPITDAMVIGQNSEKRELVLEVLKKDIHTNYKQVAPIVYDTDTESVHYVSTAKMEVLRVWQTKWMDIVKKAEVDSSVAEELLRTLKDFIGTNLLSKKETRIYKQKYCDYIARYLREGAEISDEFYVEYLSILVEMSRCDEVENLWNTQKSHLKNEAGYIKMMEYYFNVNQKAQFNNILSSLMADSAVKLSPEGLDRLRYWLERR